MALLWHWKRNSDHTLWDKWLNSEDIHCLYTLLFFPICPFFLSRQRSWLVLYLRGWKPHDTVCIAGQTLDTACYHLCVPGRNVCQWSYRGPGCLAPLKSNWSGLPVENRINRSVSIEKSILGSEAYGKNIKEIILTLSNEYHISFTLLL